MPFSLIDVPFSLVDMPFSLVSRLVSFDSMPSDSVFTPYNQDYTQAGNEIPLSHKHQATGILTYRSLGDHTGMPLRVSMLYSWFSCIFLCKYSFPKSTPTSTHNGR